MRLIRSRRLLRRVLRWTAMLMRGMVAVSASDIGRDVFFQEESYAF